MKTVLELKKPKVRRYTGNPVLRPGGPGWRKVVTFNPGVILYEGKVYLFERAAGSLHPFQCCIGLQASEDGKNFTRIGDQPVLTPAMLGYPYGSLQDTRVVRIEEYFYMTYALRPYSYNCYPNGQALPGYSTPDYPGYDTGTFNNITRSGIARSQDLVHWENIGFTTPEDIDDRNNILFPGKIEGKFVLLRRPMVGKNGSKPSIWISYSEDLTCWTAPEILATPTYEWEQGKIGGSAPPMRTAEGWLMFYHAVDQTHTYRVGAMLLDLDDPEKVIARSRDFLMEPEEYYEKTGLVIPNVIFPTGNFIKDGGIHLYYGCADTCIGYASLALDELLEYLKFQP